MPKTDRGPAESAGDRRRTRRGALVALTAVGLAVCALVAYPLLPALAWALALAVVAFPMHTRLARALGRPNLAAGLSTTVVVLVLLVPALLVAGQLGREAQQAATRAEALTREGRVDAAADRVPHGRDLLDWARQNVDPEAEARRLVGRFVGDAAALANGLAWFAVQVLVCVFVLFFAFRDWRHLLAALTDLLPLAPDETDYLFGRVSDSIHATVYARVVISVIQG